MFNNIFLTDLVFGEYLLSGLVPSVKEVNAEEPFFPAVPVFNVKSEYKVTLILFFFTYVVNIAVLWGLNVPILHCIVTENL